MPIGLSKEACQLQGGEGPLQLAKMISAKKQGLVTAASLLVRLRPSGRATACAMALAAARNGRATAASAAPTPHAQRSRCSAAQRCTTEESS